MANIQNVDYEAMPRQAKQMRNYGKELNRNLLDAYKSIEDMHSSWYGKRYNDLVKEFNRMTNEINEILQLVVTDLPFTLETVANNYSQADSGKNATTASKESVRKIQNIKLSNDVGMKFVTSNVVNVKESVSKNFKSALDKMDAINTEYNKIKWQSEAATQFKQKFTKLKTSITKAFTEINSNFTNLMKQTQEDIEKTENANKVNK